MNRSLGILLGAAWVVGHVFVSIVAPKVAFAIAAIVTVAGASTLFGFVVIAIVAGLARSEDR